MQRDYTVLGRCNRCGQATRVQVYEQGLSDDGTVYRAIYVDNVPHSVECDVWQRTVKEQWPTLF